MRTCTFRCDSTDIDVMVSQNAQVVGAVMNTVESIHTVCTLTSSLKDFPLISV